MTHAAEIARQLANRVACMRDPAALREIACVVTRLESSSRDEARASHASDRHPPVDTAACTEAGPVGSMAGDFYGGEG